MGSIFGGSKTKSTQTSNSSNQGYGAISSALTPTLNQTGTATSAIQNLLGLGTGGGPAQDQAFQNYRDNSGYNFQMQQGQQAIAGSQAAKGLLDSGSTGKALTTFGQGLADQSLNNYLTQTTGLANLGISAGNTISGAGNVSNSTGTSSGSSKKGLGGVLGAASAFIPASDPRLKKNIVRIGKTGTGLGVYEFDYTDEAFKKVPAHVKPGRQTGVMADEVADKLPSALGPIVNGYMTVDYSKIPDWRI